MSLLLMLLLSAEPVPPPIQPTTPLRAPTIVPTAQLRPISCSDNCITPTEAVTYASYLAPKAGLAGTFRMEVKAVGEQNGFYYLNSETDYRDRNCLTIAIPAAVMNRLTAGEGLGAAEKRFKGQTIFVRGVAQRVKIGIFNDAGKPTDKYYYQVHVRIGDPAQIALRRAGFADDRALTSEPEVDVRGGS